MIAVINLNTAPDEGRLFVFYSGSAGNEDPSAELRGENTG